MQLSKPNGDANTQAMSPVTSRWLGALMRARVESGGVAGVYLNVVGSTIVTE